MSGKSPFHDDFYLAWMIYDVDVASRVLDKTHQIRFIRHTRLKALWCCFKDSLKHIVLTE